MKTTWTTRRAPMRISEKKRNEQKLQREKTAKKGKKIIPASIHVPPPPPPPDWTGLILLLFGHRDPVIQIASSSTSSPPLSRFLQLLFLPPWSSTHTHTHTLSLSLSLSLSRTFTHSPWRKARLRDSLDIVVAWAPGPSNSVAETQITKRGRLKDKEERGNEGKDRAEERMMDWGRGAKRGRLHERTNESRRRKKERKRDREAERMNEKKSKAAEMTIDLDGWSWKLYERPNDMHGHDEESSLSPSLLSFSFSFPAPIIVRFISFPRWAGRLLLLRMRRGKWKDKRGWHSPFCLFLLLFPHQW